MVLKNEKRSGKNVLFVAEITDGNVVRQVVTLTTSDDPRIRNLANIFLDDYCTPEQVLKAKNLCN